MARTGERDVSASRKLVYGLGLVLQVLGLVGFLISFLGFAFGAQRSVETFGREGDPLGMWTLGVVCMVLVVVGGVLRGVGARGVAGSGLVLDPERARRDLEPWARTGGGLLRDALDESGLAARAPAEAAPEVAPEVRVRCRACRTLNDEDARFCDHCGAAL